MTRNHKSAPAILQSAGRSIIHSAGFIVIPVGEKRRLGDVVGSFLPVN